VTVKYYADVGLDRPKSNPYFVWRDLRFPGYWGLDAWDPKTRRWIDTPWLCCFTHWGEIGSEPITEQEAAEIVGRR